MPDSLVISGGSEALFRVLDVANRLGASLDRETLMDEFGAAVGALLDAEHATLWFHDTKSGELVTRRPDGDIFRVPAAPVMRGIGSERVVNIPDCALDSRFDYDLERVTGRQARCLMAIPMLGYDGSMIGLLEVANPRAGSFDVTQEIIASALAARCAMALQHVEVAERLVQAGRLDSEIAVAREIQLGTLPRTAPPLQGYDLAGVFRPTDATGGDTYDYVPTPDGQLMLLMGDATGHGFGPALSATQVRAMLRLAQRLGADLDDTFRHINDQLAADLPDDRFVTAFLGVLDPKTHVLRYHSGGQGPLLHFHAADLSCDLHPPTHTPLGALPMTKLLPPREIKLEPGDIFGLISDGVYDYAEPGPGRYGEDGVAALLRRCHELPMQDLLAEMMTELERFGRGEPQHDDVTAVLIRRLPPAPYVTTFSTSNTGFQRELGALDGVFSFIDDFVAQEKLGDADKRALGFAVEEIFTNMVKYNSAGAGPYYTHAAARRNRGAGGGRGPRFRAVRPRYRTAARRHAAGGAP
jgi:phosphoserine phosphatase